MSNGLQLSGLASGLDSAAIIQQLMAIERQPQVRALQQQRVEEARVTALQDIQTRLSNLSDAIDGLKDAAPWADVQTVESSSTAVSAVRTGGAAAGAYTVSVSQLARAAQQTQQTATSAASATGTLTFQVGAGSAATVNLTSGDTLDTIAGRINATTDIPVYATVVNGKLVVSGKTTGAANTINVGGTLAADFGFTQTLAPQDATYSLNGGADQTSASNSLTDAIVGVTLNLKATTTSAATISVGAPSPDKDAITSKIQAFVDQYNSTIDFVQQKLSEKKVAQPPSDSDRAKGILNGDSALTGLLSNLRKAVADVVSGRPASMSYLSQVGLTTGKTTGSGALSKDAVSGKLSLDATQLGDQLAMRFSDVKALFRNVTGKYATEGLGQRLGGILDPWLVGSGKNPSLMDSRIAGEQSEIKALKQRQAELEIRMTAKQDALKAQFAGLETALSKVQSEGNWLAGQLAHL